MSKILIVEDSKLFGSVLQSEIKSRLNEFTTFWAQDYNEAEKILDEHGNDFFISLLDLNLPDAPNGEIVDLVLDREVPAIVFTGDISEEARDRIWEKNVADYVFKDGEQSIDYIIAMINRLKRNQNIKVLVVDDSIFSRKVISDLLKIHLYTIFEAVDGIEAMKVLLENRDIKMVITDYNMPNMDGFELTKEIRKKFGRDELSIVGLSGEGSGIMSARFIKYGANDFINKPFLQEEFYCRITQAVEMIENVNKIKELSNVDYLTGLVNRRFLFEAGHRLHAASLRKQTTIAIAMLDIDFFKNVNDSYGHDAGDEVLREIAALLKKRFRDTDIVARFGGEEFCILVANMDKKEIFRIFDELREQISQTSVKVKGQVINVTASFGVCTEIQGAMEDMIKQADMLLYQAKENGRNRVMTDLVSRKEASKSPGLIK